ncbi:MAG: hypothetical protein ACU0BN_06915 [Sulfitobacter sp.]|uniref:hypothetical protein n=1 Tax=Sulfitobacter sp. TaxID=1903071 RepID=UPI0040585EBC
MRTAKYADIAVWMSRSAGVFGPILLGLSGVVVIARNIAFLREAGDVAAPVEQNSRQNLRETPSARATMSAP